MCEFHQKTFLAGAVDKDWVESSHQRELTNLCASPESPQLWETDKSLTEEKSQKERRVKTKHISQTNYTPIFVLDSVFSSFYRFLDKLLPEAKGRIHSLLLRSSLHRSLKAALQLL